MPRLDRGIAVRRGSMQSTAFSGILDRPIDSAMTPLVAVTRDVAQLSPPPASTMVSGPKPESMPMTKPAQRFPAPALDTLP